MEAVDETKDVETPAVEGEPPKEEDNTQASATEGELQKSEDLVEDHTAQEKQDIGEQNGKPEDQTEVQEALKSGDEGEQPEEGDPHLYMPPTEEQGYSDPYWQGGEGHMYEPLYSNIFPTQEGEKRSKKDKDVGESWMRTRLKEKRGWRMEHEGEREEQEEAVEETPSIAIPPKERGYTLLHTLGHGKYTIVKLALAKDDTPVAVRIVDKRTTPKNLLEKFIPREINAVLSLVHPHVIRHLDAFESEKRIYIVMEYAGQGTLLDLILKCGSLDENLSRRWFSHLVDALEYCHNMGVVHRDVKCESLLLDHVWDLKLGDFMYCRPVPGGLLDSTYCGSLAYAAPELLRKLPYCPSSVDVWSAGVVLFAMVFGRLPFDYGNVENLLKQTQSRVMFPKEPDVSVDCKSLLARIFSPAKTRLSLSGVKSSKWLAPAYVLDEPRSTLSWGESPPE